MSRKAVQAINWAALAERLHASDKNMYAAFKSKFDLHLRRMMANPESAPKIDWSYYKKNVALPGLVDTFQKEYEALKIPFPADKYSAQIDTEKKEMEAEINKFIQEVDESIAECRKEIEKLKAMLPFDQWTAEDYVNMYPDSHWLNQKYPTCWPHLPEQREEAIREAEGKS